MRALCSSKKKTLEGKAQADATATAVAAEMGAEGVKQSQADVNPKPEAKVAVHREVLPPRQRASLTGATPAQDLSRRR